VREVNFNYLLLSSLGGSPTWKRHSVRFMDKIHRFTRKAVAKFVYANVLMLVILIRLGFREKKVLRRLAEWRVCRYPNLVFGKAKYVLASILGPLSSTSFIKLDKPRTISYPLSNYSSKV